MDEDDRLLPILSHLALSFLQNVSAENNFFGSDSDPSGPNAVITADMIDGFAKKHFPACQYNLWQRLKKDQHLKHFGRLQFGLFLKVSSECLLSAGQSVVRMVQGVPVATLYFDHSGQSFSYRPTHTIRVTFSGPRSTPRRSSCLLAKSFRKVHHR